ncbi:hypothetical protein GF337_19530 [candidate division KSB1 bacterium]|nr:hypothetical protein [candidate division KSB1 bacterium]
MKKFALLLISLYLTGCYTVLTHPEIDDDVIAEYEYIDDNVTHYDECTQCHVSFDRFRPYEMNYHSVLNNEYDNYDWQFYYTFPWWEEERYYSLVNTDDEGNILPPTQKRSSGRRNTGVPSISSPAPSPTGNLSKSVSPNTEITTSTKNNDENSNKRHTSRRSSNSHLKKKKKSSEGDKKE